MSCRRAPQPEVIARTGYIVEDFEGMIEIVFMLTPVTLLHYIEVRYFGQDDFQ